MASPQNTSTIRPLKGLAADPWDWTIEEVVTAFCNPTGIFKSLRLESISFAKCLRDNYINGAALLTHVDNITLRNELGVNALGLRAIIEHAISRLRAGSQQWRDYKQIESVTSHSSGYDLIPNQDHVSRYATTYHTMPLRYATPIMPALNRDLEPPNSPERTQYLISGHHVLKNSETSSQHQALGGQLNSLLDTTGPSQLDADMQQRQSLLPGLPYSDHREVPPQQKEVCHGSGLTPPETREDRATSSDDQEKEDSVETVVSLRRGETYVINDLDRKR